jgi:hypothetical protein
MTLYRTISEADIAQEANWYKPAPSELYHPIIAPPDQLNNIRPWFRLCTKVLSKGVLRPASMMVPDATLGDLTTPSVAPVPSQTADTSLAKATSSWEVIPAPAKVLVASQPKKTASPAVYAGQLDADS